MTGTALVVLLGACSDESDPAPSGSASAPSASGSATGEAPAADLCPSEAYTEAADVARFAEAGPVAGAQDEGAAVHGTTWRHYVPLTVTNPLDVTCAIKVLVGTEGSGGAYFSGGGAAVLQPGETAELQLFDLESGVTFDGDAQDAAPSETLTSAAGRVTLRPVYEDYYDADITFGEITGEGADAVLPVTVTKNGVRDGVPAATGANRMDEFYFEGLDGSGAVVARFEIPAVAALDVGQTATYEVPATIAGSFENENGRAYQALDATEGITEYRVVMYQPEVLE